MKKILLGTTAIAAAALYAQAAQAQITVSLGGYTEFFGAYYDDDASNRTSREFALETEIVVRADGKADNGLLYGAKVELQNSIGAASNSVGTDEASVYLGGTWGRIELGDFDGAADTLSIYAPLIGVEQIDGDYTDFAGGQPNFGMHIPNSGDSTKIMYLTPRFAGFQAGVSYAPESDSQGQNVVALEDVNLSYKDWIEGGVNYTGEFSGFSVALGATVSSASGKGDAVAGTELEDFTAWNVGAQVGFGGFLVGGGYVDAEGNPVTGPEGYVKDDPALFGKRDERQGALWAEFASLDGRLTHRLDYQDSVLKQNNEGAGWTTGKTRKLKYRGSLGLDGRPVEDAAHILGLLAERQEDSSTAAPEYRRERTSLALEYRGFLDNGLNLQAGVRHDDNRVFDDFTSWTLALSWQVPDRPFRLHASAGTGLVNPSYYELYADDGYTRGNPYLRPEKNRGFDLGVELSLPDGRGSVDLTYFRETLEDEITYVGGTAPDWRGTYVNQPGESPREGVELAARVNATRNLDLALNYTYLDAKDPDGAVEIRRPRHELGLSATLAVLDGRGSLTADLRHVSGNFDTQFWNDQTREMPSFTVVNLAAGYDLTDNIRLTGRVVNLFDRDYSEVWGYATQGRTAYAGLQARW